MFLRDAILEVKSACCGELGLSIPLKPSYVLTLLAPDLLVFPNVDGHPPGRLLSASPDAAGGLHGRLHPAPPDAVEARVTHQNLPGILPPAPPDAAEGRTTLF